MTTASEKMQVLREMMANMDAMHRQHKGPEGYKYRSIEGLLLAEGEEYSAEPFTPAEEEMILQLSKHVHARVSQCYKNALMAVIAADMLQLPADYAEGQAMGLMPIPINHAWLVLNGKVVDFTWQFGADKQASVLEQVRFNQQENAYIGIRIPMEVLTERALATKRSPIMLDDWENKYPLLRDGVPAGWKQVRRKC